MTNPKYQWLDVMYSNFFIFQKYNTLSQYSIFGFSVKTVAQNGQEAGQDGSRGTPGTSETLEITLITITKHSKLHSKHFGY